MPENGVRKRNRAEKSVNEADLEECKQFKS
jgi:hypothetical protein